MNHAQLFAWAQEDIFKGQILKRSRIITGQEKKIIKMSIMSIIQKNEHTNLCFAPHYSSGQKNKNKFIPFFLRIDSLSFYF